ncbi:ATP-binding protein [Arthrobacter sp. JZ12]|uniref:ATP-binding protein n=1 Tax=Arthrobacter sp. JZ12 TaxID=2654190 RepID=UPI002B46691B|nr:ATP-binding protein [Arthrobacter sp. JZ12]WRH25689.1 ATP-binding protein [Arthrobacter sp. JZ12]
MTESELQRRFEADARPEAINDLHDELDRFWHGLDEVPFEDQMAFTTAVIEAASNVVEHGVPLDGGLRLGVELSATPTRLQARILEINAAAHPDPLSSAGDNPGDAESGRGLFLINALVTTVTVERQGNTNVWVLSRESGTHKH